eukprot:gene1569-12154_t
MKIIVFVLLTVVSADDVAVQTSFGSLIGTAGSADLMSGHAFLGIPFEPSSLWTASYGPEGRSASTRSTECATGSTGSEDCLFLNIWTPTTATPASSLPIMFFIHGGFAGEKVNTYDGARISQEFNVVVATINYRLGPLGFLTTKEEGEVSGNVGMVDQRLAMRWVKQEAAHFGGNPGHVNIVGETPGDMSVLHHSISPLSVGLFQRVAGEHGVPKSNSEGYGLGISSALGERLGCTEEGNALKACLASKPLAELFNGNTDARDTEHSADTAFSENADVVNMFNDRDIFLKGQQLKYLI